VIWPALGLLVVFGALGLLLFLAHRSQP